MCRYIERCRYRKFIYNLTNVYGEIEDFQYKEVYMKKSEKRYMYFNEYIREDYAVNETFSYRLKCINILLTRHENDQKN